MEIKKIKILIAVFIFAGSLYSAQFNTLMPVQPKKENQEYKKTTETQKEESVATTIKKNKKSWIKIFNSPSRSDLKNEIDSLKILIKDLGAKSSEKKSEYQKIKDSLLAITLEKARQREKQADTNYSLKKYDLVEEPEEASGARIVMPVKNKMTITSSYGTRTHPIFGRKKMHNGIDLKASYENVYSVMDGIVTAAGWDPKGGGNYMKVRHFNRFETSYLHLSEMYYRPGERVAAGYVIGRSGNSGNSTGPHLHFSVKEFGQNINPAHFLNDLIKVNNLIATYNEK